MLAACTCQCGGSEGLVRNFLASAGYAGALTIPVVQGKEASLALISHLPQFPEVEMLQTYLNSASKWAVIVGYDNENCRWSDLTHGGVRSRVEAEAVVAYFS